MTLLRLVYLGAALFLATVYTPTANAQSYPYQPDYHITVETLLWLDQWRGVERIPVETTDIRQRLRLRGFTGRTPGQTPTVYTLDLEVGADLGPEGPRLRQEPDHRRAELDLHAAQIWFRDLWGIVDIKLGRQGFYDAVGFDAVDGASIAVRPWTRVRLRAHGGLAVRRGWSQFGPDLYSPDGTALPSRPGYIAGVGAETVGLKTVAANVAWRRHFDEEIQLNELGGAIRWRPVRRFEASTTGQVDLVHRALSHGSAQLRWGDRTFWISPSWRYLRPTFSADSIWYAFGVQPYHAGRLATRAAAGHWTVEADGQAVYFSEQDAISDVHDETSESDEGMNEKWSYDGGIRLRRRWAAGSDWATAGLNLRSASGYGGIRHHGDLAARFPLRIRTRSKDLWIRTRLGATWFEDPHRDAWNGLTGWGLFAAEWGMSGGMTLEGTLEGFAGDGQRRRVRGMARIRMENWW
jgi:hypothetical protein